jgi:glycosyltransferase involved in cell wall biosynthesis
VKVSIVVPVYNGARYLAEALASLEQQAPPVEEVIVVDDGSTDGSGELAESLGARCVRRDHAGIGAARNLGFRHATGDALGFLDADDLWADGALAVQRATLEAEPGLDGVYGLVQEFLSPELTAEERARLRYAVEPQQPGVVGGLLLRRSSFDRVGEFSEEWRLGEAIDWLARAREAGLQLRTLPEVVLRRRIHSSNTGRRRMAERAEYARMLKSVLDRRRAGSG